MLQLYSARQVNRADGASNAQVQSEAGWTMHVLCSGSAWHTNVAKDRCCGIAVLRHGSCLAAAKRWIMFKIVKGFYYAFFSNLHNFQNSRLSQMLWTIFLFQNPTGESSTSPLGSARINTWRTNFVPCLILEMCIGYLLMLVGSCIRHSLL